MAALPGGPDALVVCEAWEQVAHSHVVAVVLMCKGPDIAQSMA